jgi:hypothetical protein
LKAITVNKTINKINMETIIEILNKLKELKSQNNWLDSFGDGYQEAMSEAIELLEEYISKQNTNVN